MEASLRRAGREALAGPGGRFGTDAADIAMRMRNELRIATLNWATVESFNNTFGTYRDALIEQDAWQPALFGVRALVRDVIMTLFRVTDAPGEKNDLESICALIEVFNGKSTEEIAASTGADVGSVAAGLEYLRERVPRRWGNEPPPERADLADLRLALRPVRDGLIAHAKTYSSLDLRSSVPKTRAFLRVTSELSDAACMICNVPRDDLQERWDNSLKEAERFWALVKAGANSAA